MAPKRQLFDHDAHGLRPTQAKRDDIDHVDVNDRRIVIPRASFLGIPPELRTRIYQYILCDKPIHITTRPCRPYDKGAFRSNFRTSSWGPHSRASKKWTHTICQVPDDWKNSYESSKRHEDDTSDRDVDSSTSGKELDTTDILDDYFTRHDDCNWIQDDFQDRQYNTSCTHIAKGCHVPHNCEEQLAYRQKMESIYGSPAIGLEALHADSKLHLGIILTCHQTYEEAQLTPYAGNTFDFDYPSTLQDFVSQALTPVQAAAIRNIHTGPWPLDDLKAATAALPGLRYLQYTGECYYKGSNPIVEDLKATPPSRKLDKVEVVFVFDCVRSSCKNRRTVWREHAEEMERLLGKPSKYEEKAASAATDFNSLLRFSNTEETES